DVLVVHEYSITLVYVHKVARDSMALMKQVFSNVSGFNGCEDNKDCSMDKPSQDLDHVNLFDEIVHEGPNTSYDDNDLNSHDQSDGSNSPNPSSPTIDLFKDDLGHPQGSNGSTKEDEMDVTFYPNTALSEDDVPNSLNTEHV
nr:ribonuclease H-like domain-containing protein [Tanacetum cinerariifolium]